MSTHDDILNLLRTERAAIEAELHESRARLCDAKAALAEAEATRDRASADRTGRRAATATLGAATASRLVRWRDGANQAAHHAEGAVSLAKGNVFNAQHHLEILELALQQIDALLAPPQPAEPNLIEATA